MCECVRAYAHARPDRQGADERFLHNVFGELQSMSAKMRGERGHKPRAFLAKKVLGDLVGARSCRWRGLVQCDD
jgi:hypothetical protein